ncbi:MAG TPA: AMP-binding protein [Albitalea sp.]|nr:AMP-binding protein [Albitalea sp.]
MDKIWLASYPPGVRHEISVDRPASLKALLEHSCARFADRPAFTHMGTQLSYGELDRLSRHFGAFLQNELGLAKGDRIAVMMPNCLQQPVAVLGALRAGLAVVNVNPMYTAGELAHQLNNAGAAAIVVLENFAATLEKARAEVAPLRHVVVTQLGDLLPAPQGWVVNTVVKRVKHMVPEWSLPGAWHLRDALALGGRRTLHEVEIGSSDLAFLQYTGGTTGRPKGAMLSHGNLVANVEQTIAWLGGSLEDGEETIVTALPLYHVFALTANLLTFLRLGANNVLITDPRDLKHLVATLKSTRFSAITGVNTLFDALLDAPGIEAVAQHNQGALKVAVAGGMALQRSVAERWQKLFGRLLLQGYGLSEASPIVCGDRIDATEFTGKLGLPLPSTEVAILDETGQPVPLDTPGEICVRGPQVMTGYWNAPAETDNVFTSDGWLRTGDIGRMDAAGYVEFVDRRKDIIVVSGFKAFPAEIEDAVREHPLVKDAGVVGVPDGRTGESVALFVVPRDPSLTVEMLREHCAGRLTAYKRPKTIELRADLPRTSLGKVLRRQLKDEAMQAAQAHAAA